MNEILKTIRNRRSVRKFNDIPVTEGQLKDILEAGRFAPTGGNCQTVHFVVITNAKIREDLRGLVQDAFRGMELNENHCQIHRFFPWKDVKIHKKAPYSIVAGNCYTSDTALFGSVSVSEEEAAAHPEWMSDSGEMSWNLTIDTDF